VIGERAAAAVAQIIAEAGFAVEHVSNDYGEDLLVQTSHAGRIDASRLWFQVKGTRRLDRHQRQDGRYRVSVSYEHAIKWLRSADPVVVVLWGVDAKTGYWSWPLDHVSEWEYVNSASRSTRLLFSPEDEFTPQSARVLAWEGRIHHYQQRLLNAECIDDELNETTDQPCWHFKTTVLFDFLETIGLVEITRGSEAWARPSLLHRNRYFELRQKAVQECDDEDDAPVVAAHGLIRELVAQLAGTDGILPGKLYIGVVNLFLLLIHDLPSDAAGTD
jgi:hypothetical protein